jgi:hypothetical protein
LVRGGEKQRPAPSGVWSGDREKRPT